MFTKSQIDDYQNRLQEDQEKLLLRHCKKHNIKPVICAWYDDLKDFYSDWVEELGYTKSEAKDILNGRDSNKGEFKIFSNGEIVRLVA